MDIKNSTILITGGTSGIGLAFVKQFSKMGANVIITGRNEEKLNATKMMYPNVHTFKLM